MVLPDTVVTPIDAMAQLRQVRRDTDADVVLAIFPTNIPEQLGPVRFEEGGRVVEVLDKPHATDLRNTWGMATWSPRFSTFLHDVVAARHRMKTATGAVRPG